MTNEEYKLTDEEWREFQSIPEQWFSHRAWVDARIAERVADERAKTQEMKDYGDRAVHKLNQARFDLRDERAKRPDREQIARIQFEIDNVHQIHGETCLCGFKSSRSRSRTEHLTALFADAVLALEPETDQELQDRIEALEKNLAYEVAQKIKLAEQLQAATTTSLTLEQARWKMHAGIDSRCSEEVAAKAKPVIDLVFSSLALEPETREETGPALRIDDDGAHIYWADPVEGCWVAFRRVDCVGEEELPERRLPAPDAREEPGRVEWGVAYRQNDGKLFVDEAVDYDDAVFRVANSSVYDMVVQRRVTAYAPVGAALTPEAREELKLSGILARAEEVRQDDGWCIGGAWGDYGEVVVPIRILSYVIEGELDQKIASTDPGFALTYAEQERRAEEAEAKLAEAREEPHHALEVDVLTWHCLKCGRPARGHDKAREVTDAKAYEVTEAEVEAAARKIFEYDAPSHEPDEWSGLSEPLKSDYRGTARAALEAARKVK